VILVAESEVKLCEKIIKWKAGVEVKSLKMNTKKMTVMFGCCTTDRVEEKVSSSVTSVRKELVVTQSRAHGVRNGA